MAQILLQFDLRLPLDVKERYPNFCKSPVYSPIVIQKANYEPKCTDAGSLAGPNFEGRVELKRIQK